GALGGEPEVAVFGAERGLLEEQGRAVSGGAQPPGAVSARRPVPLPFRGEAEPGPVAARGGSAAGPGAVPRRPGRRRSLPLPGFPAPGPAAGFGAGPGPGPGAPGEPRRRL